MKAEFTLPIKLISEANARGHWSGKAKRVKMQRWTAKQSCFGNGIDGIATGSVHLTVTITRIGKRKLDDDNLATSAKAIRDGIADACGKDDGSDFYTWQYAQEKGDDYAVRIQIESDSADSVRVRKTG